MTEPRIEWLSQQIDEDEAAANATAPSGTRLSWRMDIQINDDESFAGYCVISDPNIAGVAGAWDLERRTGQQVAEHIARHDPARVLRDVAAMRRIIELAAEADDIHYDRCVEVGMDGPPVLIGEQIRRALAAVYSHREGYAEHWGDHG